VDDSGAANSRAIIPYRILVWRFRFFPKENEVVAMATSACLVAVRIVLEQFKFARSAKGMAGLDFLGDRVYFFAIRVSLNKLQRAKAGQRVFASSGGRGDFLVGPMASICIK